MRQNLGRLDRILRFVFALWVLGPYGPWFEMRWLNIVMLIVGFIALVESFTAYCPLHDWLGISTKNQ